MASAKKENQKPTFLVFMVFDQMRPDYIERFDLKNFKRLKKMGTSFKNGYVGHSASVTVVSHAVMTTGLLPTNLPWSENTLLDADGILGVKDKIYTTSQLSLEQFHKLLSTIPAEQFLVQKIKKATGKKVFAVGQKDYAATIMGGPHSDTIIYAEKKDGKCKPFGINIPEYIKNNDRYTLDCSSAFGTENSIYPLDGNKYYPGNDKTKLGGDVWVADIALDIMKNEPNWGGLFLTFGAIDRFGHMLGETDKNTPHAFDPPMHLKDIALIADAQLGRILDELKKKNILDKTLIITTADHGGQTNEIFLGNPSGPENIFWLQRLTKNVSLRFIAGDTGLRLWLKDSNPENVKKALAVLKEIAQVTEVFSFDRNSQPKTYKSIYQNFDSQTAIYKKWAKERHLELANSCLRDSCPDLVVALADDTGFGKLGDHGGIQEKVQRIPIIIVGPGIKVKTDKTPMRLVDISKLVSKSFNLERTK